MTREALRIEAMTSLEEAEREWSVKNHLGEYTLIVQPNGKVTIKKGNLECEGALNHSPSTCTCDWCKGWNRNESYQSDYRHSKREYIEDLVDENPESFDEEFKAIEALDWGYFEDEKVEADGSPAIEYGHYTITTDGENSDADDLLTITSIGIGEFARQMDQVRTATAPDDTAELDLIIEGRKYAFYQDSDKKIVRLARV